MKDDKSTLLAGKINQSLYKSANAPKPYKLKPSFSPSLVGTACLRKLYYFYLRVDPDKPTQVFLARIWGTGHALHDLMRDWVKNALEDKGQLIDYRNKKGETPINRYSKKPDHEFPVRSAELEIRGKVDGVAIIADKLWILEYKSINTDKFKLLQRPLNSHLFQSCIYEHLFEQALVTGEHSHIGELAPFRGIEGTIFLYLNKNNSFIKEFVVRKNFLLFERIKSTLHTVQACAKQGQLPSATPDECHQCPFVVKCKANFKVNKI